MRDPDIASKGRVQLPARVVENCANDRGRWTLHRNHPCPTWVNRADSAVSAVGPVYPQ
jgi:hypothetical protein